MCFRELYATSPAEAMLRFRYTKSEGDILAAMSQSEIQSLSKNGILNVHLPVVAANARGLHVV
jgi:hypothetical protein